MSSWKVPSKNSRGKLNERAWPPPRRTETPLRRARTHAARNDVLITELLNREVDGSQPNSNKQRTRYVRVGCSARPRAAPVNVRWPPRMPQISAKTRLQRGSLDRSVTDAFRRCVPCGDAPYFYATDRDDVVTTNPTGLHAGAGAEYSRPRTRKSRGTARRRRFCAGDFADFFARRGEARGGGQGATFRRLDQRDTPWIHTCVLIPNPSRPQHGNQATTRKVADQASSPLPRSR
jgi:hypothetical protein